MAAKYKVIFREESGADSASQIKWEPGSPLSLSAVQISRNTETSESFLQVKALNIADRMVSEVHAEATVQYPDGSSETLTLDDLDADVKAGTAYTFDAVSLSRGDATRADVRMVKVKLADGETWETTTEPSPVVPGDTVDLPESYASARLAYLADAGCSDVASATHKIDDHGDYWVCTCGQVNLASKCAKCQLSKQDALNSEQIEFLDSVIERKKEAAAEAEKDKRQKRGRIKRIGIIAGVIVAAIVAAFAITSQIPQCNGTLTSGSGSGAYVVVKHSYVDSEGKDALVEYDVGEHGNTLKSNQIKPSASSCSYKFDDYGNIVECTVEWTGGKYSYRRSIDSVDSHGQPTRITKTDSGGYKETYEIIWYGEGHVKQVTSKTPSIGCTSVSKYNKQGELTRIDATFDNSDIGMATSRYHTDYTYEHDSSGKVVSRTGKDEDGKTTTTKYEYDSNGNVIRTTENGKVTGEYEYVHVADASPFVIMESNHFMRDCGF